MIDEAKNCRTCGIVQPLSEFRIHNFITSNQKSFRLHRCYSCEREYTRLWSFNNKDRFKARGRKRKMLKLGIPGSHTDRQWRALVRHYGFKCLKCNQCFPIERLTRDHIIPVSLPEKGATDYIWNLQPLCGPCNSSKHQKIIDYRPLRMF